MVDWVGDQGGHVYTIVIGVEKQAWKRCKVVLQLFDPNWKKKLVDGGWFTLSNFRRGKDRVQVILDHVYGPQPDISFFQSSTPNGCIDRGYRFKLFSQLEYYFYGPCNGIKTLFLI